jgi:hypothetical protein
VKDQILDIKAIQFEHAKVVKRPDGIIEVNCADNIEYELQHIKEILNSFGELGEQTKQPILVKTAQFNSITSEAREYCASAEATQYSIAEAYVITSLALKIVANFYIRINNPPVPTKIFNCEEEAVSWLNTFMGG